MMEPTTQHTPRIRDVIPRPEKRGLNAVEAAGYIGVSVSTFQKLVDDGEMPKPKAIYGRLVYDRLQLDMAFDAIKARGETSDDGWDDWQ